MSTSTVNVQIHNDLGYPMGKFWLSHLPSSGGKVDPAFGENLAAGDNSPTYQFNLTPLSTDEWTLMWSNAQGTLYGTTRFFPAEVDIGAGAVTLLATASGNVVQVVQGSKTQGSSGILQYAYGT